VRLVHGLGTIQESLDDPDLVSPEYGPGDGAGPAGRPGGAGPPCSAAARPAQTMLPKPTRRPSAPPNST
jgi:hypothetical protein